MLVFRKSQELAFSKEEELHFIVICIDFIKNELEEINPFKDDIEIQSFISEIISFARGFKIINELSIQKLIYYYLKFGFSLTNDNDIQKILNHYIVPEEDRIVNLHKFLLKRDGFID